MERVRAWALWLPCTLVCTLPLCWPTRTRRFECCYLGAAGDQGKRCCSAGLGPRGSTGRFQRCAKMAARPHYQGRLMQTLRDGDRAAAGAARGAPATGVRTVWWPSLSRGRCSAHIALASPSHQYSNSISDMVLNIMTSTVGKLGHKAGGILRSVLGRQPLARGESQDASAIHTSGVCDCGVGSLGAMASTCLARRFPCVQLTSKLLPSSFASRRGPASEGRKIRLRRCCLPCNW